MLSAIADFFTAITDVVTGLIDFVIGFISDLVYIVTLTGQFVLKIPSLFSWLPAPAVSIIVTIFGVVVIYKIMGREG